MTKQTKTASTRLIRSITPDESWPAMTFGELELAPEVLPTNRKWLGQGYNQGYNFESAGWANQ